MGGRGAAVGVELGRADHPVAGGRRPAPDGVQRRRRGARPRRPRPRGGGGPARGGPPPHGSTSASATTRPSAFDTAFWATTRTSPGWRPPVHSAASSSSAARSSPSSISGMPSSGRIETVTGSGCNPCSRRTAPRRRAGRARGPSPETTERAAVGRPRIGSG
jgi:hypothetical protein